MIDSKTYKVAVSLYEIACLDLESAVLLYNNKVYSNSIFNLQQCIEKLTKSLGLTFEIIKTDQLRSINHFPHKVYKHASENTLKELNESDFQFDDSISNALEIHKTNLEQGLKWINSQRNADFQYIDIEELNELLKFIIGEKPTEELNHNTIARDLAEQLKNFAEKVNIENKSLKSYILEYSEKSKTDIFKLIADVELVSYALNRSLLLLSLILSPHQNVSRYPCEECGASPIYEYDENHPIIIAFEKIVWIINTSIDMYEKLFNTLIQTEPEEKPADNT